MSGRYDGVFQEDMLICNQSFNNHYEESKYLAEVKVQEAMQEGLPTVIYRPGIVVGDSETGSTQKYDGPYYIMQWLLRQPKYAFLPMVGDPDKFYVNLVPSDFVVKSIFALSQKKASLGKVFQLADPNALKVSELLKVVAKITDRKLITIPLPKFVAKNALKYIPGVYALMKIDPESINYFIHPTRYSSTNTQAALKAEGIVCPSFETYATKLVEFMKEHPEFDSSAMV